MNKMHYKKFWIILGLLWIALVFYLCLRHEVQSPNYVPFIPYQDKWLHIASYLFLGWWFGRIFKRQKELFSVFFALVVMGILIEFLQKMVGYRTFEYGDMVANAVGCILGTWNLLKIFPNFMLNVDRSLKSFFNPS